MLARLSFGTAAAIVDAAAVLARFSLGEADSANRCVLSAAAELSRRSFGGAITVDDPPFSELLCRTADVLARLSFDGAEDAANADADLSAGAVLGRFAFPAAAAAVDVDAALFSAEEVLARLSFAFSAPLAGAEAALDDLRARHAVEARRFSGDGSAASRRRCSSSAIIPWCCCSCSASASCGGATHHRSLRGA